jgi:CBS domain-containing protein
MLVRDLMQVPVKTVGPNAPVGDAIVTLADGHISTVPVVDAGGRMVGVVSSTDILTSEAEACDCTERESLFADTSVSEIMTPRPLTVSPDAEVREAAQQMLYAEIHRLFVVEDGRVVGVISTSDIMRAVATGQL